ncbi:MAG: citrate synthase/methylcitrate synthase [Phenylobacterium zucineum]|nr:MAG: citrate synthase/methylcitrate synthase [Phenylobacterium zucineum]
MTPGLEGIIAAETILSDVDGQNGRLIIRGFELDQLAGQQSFEDVTALLWDGFFPDLPRNLAPRIGAARSRVFAELSALDTGLLDLSPVEAVRALMGRLADGDDLDTALNLTAAPVVFTAAVVRAKAGLAPVPPDPELSHAADSLRMLRDRPGTPAEIAALDTYLTTVCDHGLNASTFAARVVASTQAGLTSSVLAGLSALKGPLHGGAPGPIIQMLDGIAARGDAKAWILDALDRGDRLMGFGHRVYRVRDPRADALKGAVRRLAAEPEGKPGRLAFAETVEQAVLDILKARKPDRSLQTNVEFYTALLLEALAFPPATFTCVFAMGRVAGWIAHAREEAVCGRLIRPASRYVGLRPRVAA